MMMMMIPSSDFGTQSVSGAFQFQDLSKHAHTHIHSKDAPVEPIQQLMPLLRPACGL
jgi:hypothetical protein